METLLAESLADVKPETIRWLWWPYLPAGKLTLLDGDPGLGKSLLTLDVAARLSRGGELPNGGWTAPPATTIFLNAEDSAADTARPRALAAGADLNRLIFVNVTDRRAPRFPEDVPALEDAIRRHGAALAVVDPLMAFLPREVAANSDQGVRRALTPLAQVATRTGAAIWLVRHLSKRVEVQALYRGAGSTGIIGAVRSGLLLAAHPTESSVRVLSATKANLAGAVPSLGFRIGSDAESRPVLEWLGPQDFTANQVSRPDLAAVRLSASRRATKWLSDELKAGPRPANDLYEAAAKAGIPDVALERAKKQLAVKSHRVHAKGKSCWYWYDPTSAWPSDSPFRKPYELPPLEDL